MTTSSSVDEPSPAAGVPRCLMVAGVADLALAVGGYLLGQNAMVFAGLANAALLFVASRLLIGHREIEKQHREILREQWTRER